MDFILPEKGIIIYKRHFAATLMKRIMNFVMLKYIFLPKATSLISSFLFQCDSHMQFNPEVLVDQNHIFQDQPIMRDIVLSCYESRDSNFWIKTCEKIYGSFKISQLHDVLFDDLVKIKQLSILYKNKLRGLRRSNFEESQGIGIEIDNAKELTDENGFKIRQRYLETKEAGVVPNPLEDTLGVDTQKL